MNVWFIRDLKGIRKISHIAYQLLKCSRSISEALTDNGSRCASHCGNCGPFKRIWDFQTHSRRDDLLLFSSMATAIRATRHAASKGVSSNSPNLILRSTGHARVLEMDECARGNPLDFSMSRSLYVHLHDMSRDGHCFAGMLRSRSPQVFSAGSDLRGCLTEIEQYHDCNPPRAIQLGDLRSRLFRQQFHLNFMLSQSPSNVIAWAHGISMGAGAAMLLHFPYRVVGTSTKLSFPETGLGFYPAGAAFALSRLGPYGMYLALTGATASGEDLFDCGVASHFMAESQWPPLLSRLGDTTASTADFEMAMAERSFELPKHREGTAYLANIVEIERCFSEVDVESIIYSLLQSGTNFAEETAAQLTQKSPTSLEVTFQLLKSVSRMTINDSFTLEYRVARRFMEHEDFRTGVSTKLSANPSVNPKKNVNADRKKKCGWKYSAVNEVPQSEIDRFFEPLESPTEEFLLSDFDNMTFS